MVDRRPRRASLLKLHLKRLLLARMLSSRLAPGSPSAVAFQVSAAVTTAFPMVELQRNVSAGSTERARRVKMENGVKVPLRPALVRKVKAEPPELTPEPHASAQARAPPSAPRRIHLPRLLKPAYKVRRPVQKWSEFEVECLIEGKWKYPRGNWKVILLNYKDVFGDRMPVDLKDKWRNLVKYNRV